MTTKIDNVRYTEHAKQRALERIDAPSVRPVEKCLERGLFEAYYDPEDDAFVAHIDTGNVSNSGNEYVVVFDIDADRAHGNISLELITLYQKSYRAFMRNTIKGCEYFYSMVDGRETMFDAMLDGEDVYEIMGVHA